MHKRNPHRGKYDFAKLSQAVPELKNYLRTNPRGLTTIDFANPKAVLLLNRALLKCFYRLNYWSIPSDYLCPPIPGRADYIHHLADLLAGADAKQKKVTLLDIGTGANCIYPILGQASYNWRFVASDISQVALDNAQRIIDKNQLAGIELRQQVDKQAIFKGVIGDGDYFTATLCNPPFYRSADEARAQNQTKQKKLKPKSVHVQRNFSGQANELWCAGGELAFLKRMINESKYYKTQVGWFTCLVSRREHINKLKLQLKKVAAAEVVVVKMEQGNKVSRFIAWRF